MDEVTLVGILALTASTCLTTIGSAAGCLIDGEEAKIAQDPAPANAEVWSVLIELTIHYHDLDIKIRIYTVSRTIININECTFTRYNSRRGYHRLRCSLR